jgi:acyl carrier protein
MSREIETVLWAYIREQCLPQGTSVEFADTKNLFESGILDSAGLISFVGFIERKFNLEIPDEDLIPVHFVSVASIAEYIRSKQQIQPNPVPMVNSYDSSKEMHRLGSR